MISRTTPPTAAMAVLALALTVTLSGCVPAVPERPAVAPPVLEVAADGDLPRFADDMDYDGLATAIAESLTYFSRVPDDRRFRFGPIEVDSPT